MKLRSEHGFTMVELLIVMVIMGILVTMAVPKLNFVYSKNKLRASTSSVTSTLYMSRMKAVNDGQLYGVQFDAGGLFHVVRDPLNTAEQVGEINRLEDGVAFGNNSFIDGLVIFNSLGQLERACLPTGIMNGSITLWDDIGDSTNVMITYLSGRIRETNR